MEWKTFFSRPLTMEDWEKDSTQDTTPPPSIHAWGCSNHPPQSEALEGGGGQRSPFRILICLQIHKQGLLKDNEMLTAKWVNIARGPWCLGMSPCPWELLEALLIQPHERKLVAYMTEQGSCLIP